jgi:hypothetical protein
MHRNDPHPPDALLLITPDCSHCPTVLNALSTLVKQGIVGRLEIVNIATHPEIAQQLGIRSVPWVRIGSFELPGVRNQRELTRWAEFASQNDGWGEYYSHLLESGQLTKAIESIRRNTDSLQDLVHLLFSADNPLVIRIGIGAVLEDIQGEAALRSTIPKLQKLTHSSQSHTRADACHYLGLTEDPEVIPTVRALLNDDDPLVREIAKETLEALDTNQSSS